MGFRGLAVLDLWGDLVASSDIFGGSLQDFDDELQVAAKRGVWDLGIYSKAQLTGAKGTRRFHGMSLCWNIGGLLPRT